MKDFLKYNVLLLLMLSVMMVGLDFIYSYVYQNSKPRLKVQKILQQKDAHYDIAFFGSSRTENHIDCRLVEEMTGKSCINLGISGASITDMYILMEIAALNNISFDTALIQIDYNYNHQGISKYFKAGMIPFIEKPEIRKIIPDREKKNAYFQLPFYRYMIYNKVLGFRELLASLSNRERNITYSLGFTPKAGKGLAVAGTFPKFINKKNEDLDKMIKWSQNNKVSLIFFTAPYCKKVPNRDTMEKIEEKVPNLKNYIKLFDENEEFFFNCGHLNREGAYEFTEKLTQDLLLH